jgi:spore coat-associated protein N
VVSMSYVKYGSGISSGNLVKDGVSSVITDRNGNGYIDLADLNGITLDNLDAPGPMQTYPIDFDMEVRFDESAPNDYQGDECILTMKFDLK